MKYTREYGGKPKNFEKSQYQTVGRGDLEFDVAYRHSKC